MRVSLLLLERAMVAHPSCVAEARSQGVWHMLAAVFATMPARVHGVHTAVVDAVPAHHDHRNRVFAASNALGAMLPADTTCGDDGDSSPTPVWRVPSDKTGGSGGRRGEWKASPPGGVCYGVASGTRPRRLVYSCRVVELPRPSPANPTDDVDAPGGGGGDGGDEGGVDGDGVGAGANPWRCANVARLRYSRAAVSTALSTAAVRVLERAAMTALSVPGWTHHPEVHRLVDSMHLCRPSDVATALLARSLLRLFAVVPHQTRAAVMDVEGLPSLVSLAWHQLLACSNIERRTRRHKHEHAQGTRAAAPAMDAQEPLPSDDVLEVGQEVRGQRMQGASRSTLRPVLRTADMVRDTPGSSLGGDVEGPVRWDGAGREHAPLLSDVASGLAPMVSTASLRPDAGLMRLSNPAHSLASTRALGTGGSVVSGSSVGAAGCTTRNPRPLLWPARCAVLSVLELMLASPDDVPRVKAMFSCVPVDRVTGPGVAAPMVATPARGTDSPGLLLTLMALVNDTRSSHLALHLLVRVAYTALAATQPDRSAVAAVPGCDPGPGGVPRVAAAVDVVASQSLRPVLWNPHPGITARGRGLGGDGDAAAPGPAVTALQRATSGQARRISWGVGRGRGDAGATYHGADGDDGGITWRELCMRCQWPCMPAPHQGSGEREWVTPPALSQGKGGVDAAQQPPPSVVAFSAARGSVMGVVRAVQEEFFNRFTSKLQRLGNRPTTTTGSMTQLLQMLAALRVLTLDPVRWLSQHRGSPPRLNTLFAHPRHTPLRREPASGLDAGHDVEIVPPAGAENGRSAGSGAVRQDAACVLPRRAPFWRACTPLVPKHLPPEVAYVAFGYLDAEPSSTDAMSALEGVDGGGSGDEGGCGGDDFGALVAALRESYAPGVDYCCCTFLSVPQHQGMLLTRDVFTHLAHAIQSHEPCGTEAHRLLAQCVVLTFTSMMAYNEAAKAKFKRFVFMCARLYVCGWVCDCSHRVVAQCCWVYVAAAAATTGVRRRVHTPRCRCGLDAGLGRWSALHATAATASWRRTAGAARVATLVPAVGADGRVAGPAAPDCGPRQHAQPRRLRWRRSAGVGAVAAAAATHPCGAAGAGHLRHRGAGLAPHHGEAAEGHVPPAAGDRRHETAPRKGVERCACPAAHAGAP